jgi:uncharacterized membrane protein YeaQ/YmgE (transglycosylase-associated protein family)
MISIITWIVYGLLVGGVAKAIVPGEEHLNWWQTVFLGVVGSYTGGAIMYLLGSYDAVTPAGLFMGIVGAVAALCVYNQMKSTN